MHNLAPERVSRIIETFRSVDKLMSTGAVAMFVVVARDPGNAAEAYAERTGLVRRRAYRVLSELGNTTRRQDREVGLGLIEEVPHPEDGRRKLYRLTPRGEVLWKKVLQAASIEEASQG